MASEPYYCESANAGCIQTVLTNGPVETSMVVYGDIWSYKSGIYSCQGKPGGGSGHSVVIIGWGVSNGTAYWTVKNSWGPTWGEGGFFKVTRGINDCGIEGGVWTAMPKPKVH